MKERENFGSRFAVIMAMAGSAIGLGNIWRFPYMVGEYGGAAFIIIYILASFFLALPIFLSESIIGRRSRSNTFGAMRKLAPGSRWKWLGLLIAFTPLLLLSYYSVVGGWAVEYLFKALAFEFTTSSSEEISTMFQTFTENGWMSVIMHTLFLAMVAIVIVGGVKKGIEKFSNITMPVLFVMIVIIAVYSVLLPGAGAGVDYLLKPDFSKINLSVITAAMGQSFYSLSLGVGTILIYSSYVRKDENLMVSGVGTAIFDLFFAILAGVAVMPAVFAAGIAPGAGPGLVFETLPYIFSKMSGDVSWLSGLIAIIFFLSILVAALSSAISIMEACVAYFCEERNMSRRNSTLLVFFIMWALGVLCALSFGPLKRVIFLGRNIFDLMDGLCSNILMPLGGLLFCLFAGWKMTSSDVRDEFTNGGTLKFNSAIFGFVLFLIRFVAPVTIVLIFVTNLLI